METLVRALVRDCHGSRAHRLRKRIMGRVDLARKGSMEEKGLEQRMPVDDSKTG